jgi:hypothetical protein
MRGHYFGCVSWRGRSGGVGFGANPMPTTAKKACRSFFILAPCPLRCLGPLTLTNRARIFKLLRTSGIDSTESIPSWNCSSGGGDVGSENEINSSFKNYHMEHGRVDSLLGSYSIPGIDFSSHNPFKDTVYGRVMNNDGRIVF